ncbi:glycosyltransferase [Mucilaginibacter glaciei]|uniref:Glycosyltransferase n=1 Tax=Mucilaginibacter glaciei TaxID=2772109 RepID=A0A926S120_9SPHI|nr:glycosyltransferase [Mucilaginibacter glaciei]MBD1392322.1 glycosyltransferase [Mucilaginibacter glaciei]
MDLKKIIAVIVLYKSSLEESVCFQSLLKSVDSFNSQLLLVVYNNSPDYWQYGNDSYKGVTITYLEDHKNSGVSKAYNTAFDYGIGQNKEYILLLDQDTQLEKLFFNVFFDYESKFNKDAGLYCPMICNDFGLLSPAKFFLYSSQKLSSIEPGVHSLEPLAIINSGLIISTKLYQLNGGYNEKIKLDFSDFDFLRRVLTFTKLVVVLDVKCKHELSGESKMPLASALNRFDYYLEGALYYKKTLLDAIGLSMWIMLRSVKLGVKYKTAKFATKTFGVLFKNR